MEQMSKFPDNFLPQARRALRFIRYQLSDLIQHCDCMLKDGPVNPQGFLILDNCLKKVLYETHAVCNPPQKKPKKSDFDVVKFVAHGAFGTVSHVRHKQTRQSFAMKEFKQDEKQRSIVLQERDILTFLVHPLVISMFCSFETEMHKYIVMEYVGGGDFKDLLTKFTHLSVKESRFYTAELVLALEYIHKHGIIHRDLKLGNLLISSEGHLKVADFGLSKLATVDNPSDAVQVAREFTDKTMYGTPMYMAPEVFLGTGYGKPVDWWAVGVIFFKFLTGLMPFHGKNLKDLSRQVIKGYIHWPMNQAIVPVKAYSLLSRLLETDPVWRLGTRGASEVKKHPFFTGVDWDKLMSETPPYVPKLKDEDKTSCSKMSPPPVFKPFKGFVEGQSVADAADFCYVAFRFNDVYQVYDSPRPISPVALMNRFPMAETLGISEKQHSQDFSNLHNVFNGDHHLKTLHKIPKACKTKSPLLRSPVSKTTSSWLRNQVRTTATPLSRGPVRATTSPLCFDLMRTTTSPLRKNPIITTTSPLFGNPETETTSSPLRNLVRTPLGKKPVNTTSPLWKNPLNTTSPLCRDPVSTITNPLSRSPVRTMTSRLLRNPVRTTTSSLWKNPVSKTTSPLCHDPVRTTTNLLSCGPVRTTTSSPLRNLVRTPLGKNPVSSTTTPLWKNPLNTTSPLCRDPVSTITNPLSRSPVRTMTSRLLRNPVRTTTSSLWKNPVSKTTSPLCHDPVRTTTNPLYRDPVNTTESPLYHDPVRTMTNPLSRGPVRTTTSPLLRNLVRTMTNPLSHGPVRTTTSPLLRNPVRTLTNPLSHGPVRTTTSSLLRNPVSAPTSTLRRNKVRKVYPMCWVW